MPGYPGKKPHFEMSKKWGGRGGNQRNDRRGTTMQNRRGGAMLNRNVRSAQEMVSPWESGMTPGMQITLTNQNAFSQPSGSSFYLSGGQSNFQSSNYGGYGVGANKIRRVQRQVASFDDQRGQGLLPPPGGAPLLGVSPTQFPLPSRGVPEYLQQRMGTPWDRNIRPGANSGYFSSGRGRQDNSRKFLKARRPQNKPANSKGSGGRDFKTKPKGAAPKKVDKEVFNNKETKSTKGGVSLPKSERAKGEKAKPKDDIEVIEVENDEVKEKEEPAECSEENKTESKENKAEPRVEEEKGTGEGGKKEKAKKKAQEDNFPVKALYCHICELDNFTAKQGYIRHLQGMTHAKMAELYHAKNAATLELLNISAKLSEMRQRDKVLRRTGKKSQSLPKTTERALVQKWLKVGSCCGTKFKSPFGLEEHKLSVQHLKSTFTAKGSQKPNQEAAEEEKENEQEESHDEVVRASAVLEAAKKEAESNPISMESLAVYNPSEKIGMEYVVKTLRFRCIVCKGQMFRSLETHCQSHSHFDNITTHLNKLEEQKLEAARKEKEEKEKQATEEAKKEELNKDEADAEKAKEEVDKTEEKEEEKTGEKEDDVIAVEEEKVTENVTGDEDDDEGADGLPSDYITVDCYDEFAKDDNSDQEMDEDILPLGEDEVRILGSSGKKRTRDTESEPESEPQPKSKPDSKPEPEPEAEADEEEEDVEDIFEEVGEKIDLENGKGEKKKRPKKWYHNVPRRGRGRRAAARGRRTKY